MKGFYANERWLTWSHLLYRKTLRIAARPNPAAAQSLRFFRRPAFDAKRSGGEPLPHKPTQVRSIAQDRRRLLTRWKEEDGPATRVSVIDALQRGETVTQTTVAPAVGPRETGDRLDLRRIDLSGLDLDGAQLQDVDLQGANLARTKLRGAQLQGADLREALLRKADLRRADLTGAKLGGAVLEGALLDEAVVEETVTSHTTRVESTRGPLDIPSQARSKWFGDAPEEGRVASDPTSGTQRGD